MSVCPLPLSRLNSLTCDLSLPGAVKNTKSQYYLLFFQSTGDSLDDNETETRRNTSYNEIIDADNPQTPEDVSTLIQLVYELFFCKAARFRK